MSIFNLTACCEEIKSGRTFFNFFERAFDIIFESTFNKEIGLQCFMNFLSLSIFFSINLIRCDVLGYPISLASLTESTKVFFSSSQTFSSSHRYLEIYHFALFLEIVMNLFWLNLPHRALLDPQKVLEHLITFRRSFISVVVFCARFLKSVS